MVSSNPKRPAAGSPAETAIVAAEAELEPPTPASSTTAAEAKPVRGAGALRRAVAVAPAASGPRCPPPAVTPRAAGAGALPGPRIAGPFGRHRPPLPTPAPAPRRETSQAVHAARGPQKEVEDEDLL